MTAQQKNIVRIAALADVLIAVALLIGIIGFGLAIPIVVPPLLALAGIMLIVVTFAL